MNVACPALDRPADKQVDELDDGCFRGQVLQVAHIFLCLIVNRFRCRVHILDDLVDILRFLTVESSDVFVYRALLAGAGNDVGARCHPEGVDDLTVSGAHHEHLEHPILELHGNDPVLPDETAGNAIDDERDLGEIVRLYDFRILIQPRLPLG